MIKPENYHQTMHLYTLTRFLLLLTCCLPILSSLAAPILCGTDAYQQQLIQENPKAAKLEQKMNELAAEKIIQAANDPALKLLEDDAPPLMIPVVIHIMHAGNTPLGNEENITEDQVYQSLTYLNDAFRNRSDFDPTSGVDMNIEFCLANIGPTGQATNGIVRHASNKYASIAMHQGEDTLMKKETGWNRDFYMNIWVVKEICYQAGCNVAGFSTLASAHGSVRDGIVIRSDHFGNDLDDTKAFIHEVGHFLGLYHTFQNGCTNNDCLRDGDFVCDTPPDGVGSFQKCSAPFNSCETDSDDESIVNPFRPINKGGIGGQDDEIENYMDYASRYCQSSFTAGQRERVALLLTLFRSSFFTSPACGTIANQDAGIVNINNPTYFSCSSTFQPAVTLRNFGISPLTSVTIKYQLDNGTVYTKSWTGNLASQETTLVTLPENLTLTHGNHTFTAYTIRPNNITDPYSTNDAQTIDLNYVEPVSLPFVEEFETTTLANHWLTINPDNDKTWESNFNNACGVNGSRNIALTNTNYLPLGLEDYLFTQLDLSEYVDATLQFNVAYVPRSTTTSDIFKVVVSTDCGGTFQTVYEKQGNELMTGTAPQTATWSPTSCADWRTETINLLDFANQPLIVGFVNVGLGANKLYVDKVSVTGTEELNCDLPSTMVATILSPVSAEIIWSASEDAIANNPYNVRYRPIGSPTWTGYEYFVTSPLVLNSLEHNTNYEIQIQTNCAEGLHSNFGQTTLFTTPESACPPVTNLKLVSVDAQKVILSWTAQADIYQVTYQEVGVGTTPVNKIVYDNQADLTDLTTNTTYEISVIAVCGGGVASFPTGPVVATPIFQCKIPENLLIEEVTNIEANVAWKCSEDNNDELFIIEYRMKNTSNWSSSFVNNCTYKINNLVSSTPYEVRVRSYCMVDSTQSDPTATVSFISAEPCQIPTDLQVVTVTDSSATLKWQQIPDIENYKLSYHEVGGNITVPIDTKQPIITVNNLNPCTDYIFSVNSKCLTGGVSEQGAEYRVTTRGECSCNSYGETAVKEWIKYFSLGSFSHESTKSDFQGYEDHTEKVIAVNKGETYTVNMEAGLSVKRFRKFWKVWIDFDQDSIMEVHEEVFSGGLPTPGQVHISNSTFVSGQIKIPAHVPTGQTRVRVAMKYGGWPDICEVFPYGEVEDYTINIGNTSNKTTQLIAAKLFPNPAKEYLQINLPPTKERTTLSLFNAVGEKVKAQEVDTYQRQHITWEVKNLAAGIYLLKIDTGKSTSITQKVIIVD